jgi:hypothetical protein
VLKEIAEAYPAGAVSLHVVWMPMVPGDDARAARETGSMFAGFRVHQYYDGERAVGLAFHREVFPHCLREIVAATPDDHPMHDQLGEWLASSPNDRPLWDAVLYFPKGAEWTSRAPRPVRWSKQVGFMGGDAGDVTGVFLKNDCHQPPVDSDWHREVRRAMKHLLAAERSGSY